MTRRQLMSMMISLLWSIYRNVLPMTLRHRLLPPFQLWYERGFMKIMKNIPKTQEPIRSLVLGWHICYWNLDQYLRNYQQEREHLQYDSHIQPSTSYFFPVPNTKATGHLEVPSIESPNWAVSMVDITKIDHSSIHDHDPLHAIGEELNVRHELFLFDMCVRIFCFCASVSHYNISNILTITSGLRTIFSPLNFNKK